MPSLLHIDALLAIGAAWLLLAPLADRLGHRCWPRSTGDEP